ncbi:hypothetical protein ACOME3_007736 [Neoechinorhynchus agilis]
MSSGLFFRRVLVSRSRSMEEAGINHAAPYFETEAVVEGRLNIVSLSEYKEKFLVIFFYPLAFEYACPTAIAVLNNRAKDFHKINCEALTCSTASKSNHLAWSKELRADGAIGSMKFTMLTDGKQKISKSFGFIKDGAVYKGFVIVDPKGILRHITIDDIHLFNKSGFASISKENVGREERWPAASKNNDKEEIERKIDQILKIVEAFRVCATIDEAQNVGDRS